jgi:hypothetical protein
MQYAHRAQDRNHTGHDRAATSTPDGGVRSNEIDEGAGGPAEDVRYVGMDGFAFASLDGGEQSDADISGCVGHVRRAEDLTHTLVGGG